MGEKLVIGPINHGLRTDRTAFVIDNDSFPTLINAYQWRGRIKRKRGTSLLGRLTRFFNSTSTSYSSTSSINLVAGAANILTGFSLEANGNIVPGSVTIIDTTAGNTYTDSAMDGTLVGAPAGTGTINYATGDITITGGAADAITVTFLYQPDLPVMGLEDRNLNPTQLTGTIAFDTVYSYNIDTSDPYPIYDVSFYKSPASAGKVTPTPVRWNGADYQQFWTVNYAGALWATNGITVPFTTTNIGMQFKPITTVTVLTPTTATLNIVGHGLVVGDYIFVNEVLTTTGINLQTGIVTIVVGVDDVTVSFPNATMATNGTRGIAQYLTSNSDSTKDCIRWYDGDPTDGSPTTPTLNGANGWVNFMPPLSSAIFSISDLPARVYYLVGARFIVPFKDRLLFLGPVVQASTGTPFYLQDTVVYSQNGTPYYTASFTGNPLFATTIFNELLVPTNQTASPPSFIENTPGFGGSISAGVSQAINTTSINEDVLIVGFTNIQTKLVYSGSDIVPFNFFFTNSEYGSSSPFSAINLDKGVITKGPRAFVITSQVEAARVDLEIPDQVFQVNLTSNGNESLCAQRDFINEWVYFTYTANEHTSIFPNQTLQFNYRDNSWAILNESYTTYGQFKRRTGFIWSTVGNTFPSWISWNEPWDAGDTTLEQPEIIGGNQQGFVIFRNEGTNESNSLYIQSFSGNTITSPDHGLNENDFIIISGAIGTISTEVNDKIFKVYSVTQDTFKTNPSIASGTYFGEGVIKRMYIPFIMTKQFPLAWEMARKTRIGSQKYLLSKTPQAQITLLIFLSQDASNPYNDGSIVPDITDLLNNGLIYSNILYTCPESTNIGLTAANSNLQTPTASNQAQIWHRVNTSLIGDTVQLGFTMSDEQMRKVDDDGNPISQFAEIELHSIVLEVSPSQMLV